MFVSILQLQRGASAVPRIDITTRQGTFPSGHSYTVCIGPGVYSADNLNDKEIPATYVADNKIFIENVQATAQACTNCTRYFVVIARSGAGEVDFVSSSEFKDYVV
jgi:hypothetical protein